MNKEGLKIVISGPSGSGKGTIVNKLIENENSIVSISATTRKPRVGEVDGKHYFFRSKEDFEEMIRNNELLEYARFCDNYYGTPKKFVEDTTASGKNIILEIEVEGALQVKEIYPEAVFIFVIPPSLEELRQRLIDRQTETIDVIDKRLSRAKEELPYYKEYDYLVVNDDIDSAVTSIENIINCEMQKSSNFKKQIESMIKER
ncbi:MAG: guanylate kinase [Epulopiscium sp.]|nr:guanylate kinase [Candidatus Epulonipiscium sp.]